MSYLQNSLAAGQLGLFLSSLHQPLGHTGEIAYPDFYLDNNPNGPNLNGNAPKIELAVTILDDSLAGDLTGDGLVNGSDFLKWQRELGGATTAADLEAWRSNYGDGAGVTPATNVASVPEPAWLALTGLAAAAIARVRRQRRR